MFRRCLYAVKMFMCVGFRVYGKYRRGVLRCGVLKRCVCMCFILQNTVTPTCEIWVYRVTKMRQMPCLYRLFFENSSIIGGSFAERDLQLKASYTSFLCIFATL